MTEQGRYQIRFDWAASGAHALAETGDLDVIVWVDVVPGGIGAVRLESLPGDVAVVEASIATAAAVARWIVTLQHHLARRVVVAVVAAGETRFDGSLRFAVEDQLAAGAIIDQLNQLGLDATSPEAAVAEAAFLQLKPAVSHLVSASVSAVSRAQAVVARVDSGLGPEDVLVRRHHPEA